MLIPGSNVVINSIFSRAMLASPLICKKSVTNLVIKTRQVKKVTENPQYFIKRMTYARSKVTLMNWQKMFLRWNSALAHFTHPKL